MKILIISNTPLVNSPYNFKLALENENHSATLIHVKPYPKHKNFFNKPDFYSNQHQILEKKYDLLFFHNILDDQIFNKYESLSKKKILMLHSTIFDGPIFDNYFNSRIVSKFDKIFSLNQGHSRFYPDAKILFNIIHPNIRNKFNKISKKLNIAFVDSLSGRGRYGSKNPEDSKIYIKKNLSDLSDINFKLISNLTHKKVLHELSISDIVLDDLYTGAFHQVSLEAIASGALAFNGADAFTIKMFLNSIKANDDHPFIICNKYEDSVEKILILNSDRKKLKLLKNINNEFFNQYLTPKRLINIFLSEVFDD